MHRLRQPALTLALAILAGCAAPAPTGPAEKSIKGTLPGGLPVGPSTTRPASPGAGGDLGTVPAVGPTPPTGLPAATPLPSVAPLVSPPPATGAGLISKAKIEGLLGEVARLDYANLRAQGFAGAARVITNNGSSLITNNGGTLLANNAASLIGNNAAGIIADNGAGILADNGASYALQALRETVSTLPMPGEVETFRLKWLTGESVVHLAGTDAAYRQIRVSGTWRPVGETRTVSDRTETATNTRIQRQESVALNADGSFGIFADLEWTYRDGKLQKLVYLPSVVRDAQSGLNVELASLTYDLVGGTGAFDVKYPTLGRREVGTLKAVQSLGQAWVPTSFVDPLEFFPGESRVEDADGKLLYTKRQGLIEGVPARIYGLGDGVELVIPWQPGILRAEGYLAKDGKSLGAAVFERADGGGVTFTVALADGPLVVTATQAGAVGDAGATAGGSAAPGATPTPSAPPAGPAPVDAIAWTLAGSTAGYAPGTRDDRRDAKLDKPVGLALLGGWLYVADTGNDAIRRIPLERATAPAAYQAMPTIAGGPGAAVPLVTPAGLAAGPDGALYFTELTGQRVRKLVPNAAGGFDVVDVAGDGTAGFADGAGATARFNTPIGLAFGPDGALYVGDVGNHRVRRIAADGTVTTAAGSATKGRTDGVGQAASFDAPVAITKLPDGRLLVADEAGHRIAAIALEAGVGTVSTVVGAALPASGVQVYLDGPLATAVCWQPRGLAVAQDGTVYVSDGRGGSVRRLDFARGDLRTVAGTGEAGALDGPGVQARFTLPLGLALIGDGDNQILAIADQGASTLRGLLVPKAAREQP